MRLSLIVLFMLILLPSAYGIGISDIEFYSHGEPLKSASLSVMPNIDIKITVDGDNFSHLVADVSGIHRNPVYAQINHYNVKTASRNSCYDKNGSFECHLTPRYGFQMHLESGEITIPVELHDLDGNITPVEHTVSLTIDNTPPTVIDMRSERCLEDACYVASGDLNNLVIKFDQGPFEKALVRYQLGSQTRMVDECSGSTCTGKTAPICNSHQVIPFSILKHQTFDDAYNQVMNSYSQDLICDSESPEVLNHTVEGATAEYVKIGDTMIITLNVTDDIGPVSGVANLSSFGVAEPVKGECVKNGPNYQCTFSATVQGEGPYTEQVDIIIRDFAGNFKEYYFLQEIYGLSDEIGSNYWNIDYDAAPTKINKQTMPYVAKNIYVPITLKSASSRVEVLGMEVGSCEPLGDTTNTYLGTNKPELFNLGMKNRDPVIKFTLQKVKPAEEDTRVKFNCSLMIQTRKTTNLGKYFVEEKEKEELIIEYSFVNLKSPAEMVKKEIEEIQEAAEKWNQWIEPIYEAIIITKQTCEGLNMLNQGSAALNTVGIALNAVPGAQGAAKTVNKGGNYLGFVPEKLGGQGGQIEMCEFLTCKSDYNKLVTDKLTHLPVVEGYLKLVGYGTESSDGSFTPDYSMMVNPDDSLIMSVAMACVPSMLYNLQKLRAIDCEYAECLAYDVAEGVALVSDCAKMRSYMNCKYWVGEIFEVLPISVVVDDAINFLKDSFDDPVSAFGTSLSASCFFFGNNGDIMEATCNLAADVSKIMNFVNNILSFADTYKRYKEPSARCEAIFERIETGQGYEHEIGEVERFSYGWDDDLQCGVTGCQLETAEGKQYLAMPRYEDDERTSFVWYEKKGNSYVQVDNDDVPEDVQSDADKNYKSWEDQWMSQIPPDIRTEFQQYVDAREIAASDLETYQTDLQDYNNFKSAYDNYQDALRRYNRLSNRQNPDPEKVGDAMTDLKVAAEDFREVGGITQTIEQRENEVTRTTTNAKQGVDEKEHNDKKEDQLKTDKNTAKKDMKKSERDANRALRDAERAAQAQLNWPNEENPARAFRTTLNTVRGFNSMSNFLQEAGVVEGWREDIDRAFHNDVLGILDEEYRKSMFCESKLQGPGSDIAIRNTGVQGTDTAARITGERSAVLTDENNTDFRTYAIAFMVNPKKPGLRYDIVLKGAGNSEVVFTNKTTEDDPIHVYTEDETLFLESEKLFTKACIRFHFNNWKEYFDVIVSPDDNELCDGIREVES